MKYGILLLVYNLVRQQTQYIRGATQHETYQEYQKFVSCINKTMFNYTYQEAQGEQYEATLIVLYFYPPHCFETTLCAFKCSIYTSCLPKFEDFIMNLQYFSERNTFSCRNDWMTLANSGHLLTAKCCVCWSTQNGLPRDPLLEKYQHNARNAGEWKVMVSTGKWRQCSWRQCFRMADINDSPVLCTHWMFSFQKSIKTTESFQVIFFYCETRNHADNDLQ